MTGTLVAGLARVLERDPSRTRSRRSLPGLLPATVLAVALSAVPARAAAERTCSLPVFGPGRGYRPHIVPRDFGPRVTNPWFPLVPGRTLVYAGTKDGRAALDIFAPSARTKVIARVRTRVVEDRLYLAGRLAERTTDYYAQDRCGNVWYFGEDTAELDRRGRVTSREGSWRTGVKGAKAGVYMRPELGRHFRQEWYRGQAEDIFRAIDLSAPISVPLGRFRRALETEETTALEPGVVDHKYYARGVGELLETSVRGARETLRLVEVIR